MWSKDARLILVSGPSGAGKSTVVKEIFSLYGPKMMAVPVSYTTRPRRGVEKEAVDYYFVSRERFLSLKDKGFFAEWACVYKHYYGTALEQLEKHWQKGLVLIKDFDLQGVSALKKLYPQALRVFIAPPSVEELINRVRKRRENSDEDIQLRIQQAQKEMERGASFEHYVENTDLQKTLEKMKKIIETYLKTI